MKALVKDLNYLGVRDWPKPIIKSASDVLIKVVMAGICRTDIYVAQNLIKSTLPLILGHEFSGIVESTGSAVTNVKIGDRVSVMPLISCNNCSECKTNHQTNCLNSCMLGLDQNGAFAEFIVVNSYQVYPLPSEVSFQLGAYLEPVCAALAVLKANIQPYEKGLIYGENRIAALINKILIAKGFESITIFAPNKIETNITLNCYDFVIETLATKEALEDIVKLIKPRGKVVLKSRQYSPISFDLISAIKKEITFQAVNYSSFLEALELVTDNQISFLEMFGEVYSLEDFEHAFHQSSNNDSLKRFFSLV